MNEPSAIDACLVELRCKRETLDQLIRNLEQFQTPRYAKPAATNGRHTTPKVGKRSGVVQPLREVVDELAEPFTAADAETALLARYPDKKKGRGMVGYYLRTWGDQGQLQVVTAGRPGQPTSFKRSAAWSVDPTTPTYSATNHPPQPHPRLHPHRNATPHSEAPSEQARRKLQTEAF